MHFRIVVTNQPALVWDFKDLSGVRSLLTDGNNLVKISVSPGKPAVKVQNLLIREKALQFALVGGKSAHPSEKLPYYRGNQRENPQGRRPSFNG
jgi:hypothetical protein